MGVAGLWELLRPMASRTSLSTLSKEAVMSNRNSHRALIIGIDASLWIFHAATIAAAKGGENPILDTIFHRIAALRRHPVLPVFVFDGPKKPHIKRGQRVAGRFGTSDRVSRHFKELLDECGLEWWNAPGEAEAELAVMNRQGKIDAIISDDGDTMLFGAQTVLRNNSAGLSGAQASSIVNSQKSKNRVYETYQLSAILDTWRGMGGALTTEEDCRLAMVFVAILAGGDYAPEGLKGFGATTAIALAHAGHAAFLADYRHNPERFEEKLKKLLVTMAHELETNSSGFLSYRQVAKAKALRELDVRTVFPEDILDAYLFPTTSSLTDLKDGWPGFGLGNYSKVRGMAREGGRGDMEGMARACERFFEWGTAARILKKFSGDDVGVFEGELVNEALLLASFERRTPVRSIPSSSPPRSSQPASSQMLTSWFASSISSVGLGSSSKLTAGVASPARSARALSSLPSKGVLNDIVKVEKVRSDPLDGAINQLRVLYNQARLAERVRSSVIGHRIDPKLLPAEERARLGLTVKEVEEDDAPPASQSAVAMKDEIRAWVPEYLARAACPELVAAWDESQKTKRLAEEARLAKHAAKVQRQAEKRGLVVNGENTEKFANFFSQAAPSLSQRVQRHSPSEPINLSASEEEEPLEPWELIKQDSASSTLSSLPPSSPPYAASAPLPPSLPIMALFPIAGVRAKNRRPAPTTSLSSLSPAPSSRATSNAASEAGSILSPARTVESTPKPGRHSRTATAPTAPKVGVTATRSSPRLRTASGRTDAKVARAATPLVTATLAESEHTPKTQRSRRTSGSMSKTAARTRQSVTRSTGKSKSAEVIDLCASSGDEAKSAHLTSRSALKVAKPKSKSPASTTSTTSRAAPPPTQASKNEVGASFQQILALPAARLSTSRGDKTPLPPVSTTPALKRRGRPPKSTFITVKDSSDILWIDCTGRARADIFAAEGLALPPSPSALPAAV